MRADASSTFGELLRRYRAAAGLTQEELAERARLSSRGIADLERGARAAPLPRTIRQLADALGLGDDERAALLVARIDALGVTRNHRRGAERPSGLPGALPLVLSSFVGREARTCRAVRARSGHEVRHRWSVRVESARLAWPLKLVPGSRASTPTACALSSWPHSRKASWWFRRPRERSAPVSSSVAWWCGTGVFD
jgi:transcriptional regulator with XRE-family HTH domain